MRINKYSGSLAFQNFAAFTLIESLSAIAILTIAGTATFMTIEWTLSTNRMPLEVQADAILRLAAAETQKQKRYIDEAYDLNGWQITRTVEASPGFNNCYSLHFAALDEHGRIISSYDEIIFTP